MNVIDFGDAACKRIRGLLDSYLSDELSVETSQEVQRHLESCEGCSKELERKTRLRSALRAAVRADQPPPQLLEAVRAKVRRSRSPLTEGVWIGAAAAIFLVVTGTWWASIAMTGFAPHEYLRYEAHVRSLVGSVSPTMGVGLGDHVICAYYHPVPEAGPDAERVLGNLGPGLATLVPLIEQGLGEDFDIRIAHRCRYRGREFVHVAALGERESILSFVMTDKLAGDSFAADGLTPAAESGGAPIYAARAGQFEIAGFEPSGRLAYVVSDLPRERNLELAGSLAPEIVALMEELAAWLKPDLSAWLL